MNPSPTNDEPPPPREIYAQRVAVFDGDFAELSGQQNRLSNARLLTALAAIILIGWFIADRQVIALIAALAITLGFLWLVVQHRRPVGNLALDHSDRRSAGGPGDPDPALEQREERGHL